MIIQKLNESYSVIDDTPDKLKAMYEFLKVERPGAFFEPLVKAGMKSKYNYFGSIQNKKLLVMNGHLELLKQFGVVSNTYVSDYTEEELDTFLSDTVPSLPFTPYDFQIKAFKESILNGKQINKCCTSSGKSLIVSLIAEFFRTQNKKGLLLVPNINLLTQFCSDINDYQLSGLREDVHLIGGGNTDKHFNKSLTISTWQSMMRFKEELDDLDYVITDEAHRFASEETADIVRKTTNCRYKFGFTGTVPDNPVQKMELIGLFGLPKTYITSRELIDRKLATPININSIIFKYNSMDKKLFKEAGAYAKQLKFIKDHEKRTEFIVKLSTKLSGNTLVLGQHIDHLKTMYLDIMEKLHPEVTNIPNKLITGKHSFEFQEKYGVYYISGSDDTKTREKTRNILEHHNNAILVSNYQLLGTGVNIRRLHNIVLASPLKSFSTITQSIGRLMRLHKDKKEANVYDLVDDFSARGGSGVFVKQYKHRVKTSYNPEEYPINEQEFNLFS